MTDRPLVFLDVDGVINDIEANRMLNMLSGLLEDRTRRLNVDVISSHGHWLAVPKHMPSLIQRLAANTEVWWCTTWRSRANGEIIDHLGVAPLPVVDPDGDDAGTAWKTRIVAHMSRRFVESGRRVVWIEDFAGPLPQIEGVELIDTTAGHHLRQGDLPEELLH